MQIIESIRLMPCSIYSYPCYATKDSWMSDALRDKINREDDFGKVIKALEELNQNLLDARKILYVGLRIEYSTDPIGTLTQSPAMGGTYNQIITLGSMDGVMCYVKHTRPACDFTGYLDLRNNVVIPVDLYSKA